MLDSSKCLLIFIPQLITFHFHASDDYLSACWQLEYVWCFSWVIVVTWWQFIILQISWMPNRILTGVSDWNTYAAKKSFAPVLYIVFRVNYWPTKNIYIWEPETHSHYLPKSWWNIKDKLIIAAAVWLPWKV